MRATVTLSIKSITKIPIVQKSTLKQNRIKKVKERMKTKITKIQDPNHQYIYL